MLISWKVSVVLWKVYMYMMRAAISSSLYCNNLSWNAIYYLASINYHQQTTSVYQSSINITSLACRKPIKVKLTQIWKWRFQRATRTCCSIDFHSLEVSRFKFHISQFTFKEPRPHYRMQSPQSQIWYDIPTSWIYYMSSACVIVCL